MGVQSGVVSTGQGSGAGSGAGGGLGGYGSALTALGRIAEWGGQRSDAAAERRAAEAEAKLTEQEAEGDARERERRAGRDAAGLRQEQQRARARSLVAMGASGLALSGSPMQALQGRAVSDETKAADLETEGRLDADAIRRSGASEAARRRSRAASGGSDLSGALGLAGSLLSQGGSPWRTVGMDL